MTAHAIGDIALTVGLAGVVGSAFYVQRQIINLKQYIDNAVELHRLKHHPRHPHVPDTPERSE